MANTPCICYIYIYARPCFLLSPNHYSYKNNICVLSALARHNLTMSMSKGLMAFGVLMLLMTTFVAGDVADTITRKPKYLSYEGLPRCDPEKNPQCLHPVAPGRGCKAEDRCREG
ncbi:hypothetical protein Peur_069470 [Populus x canadensis]